MAEQQDEVVVVGAGAHPLRDAYHSLLKMRWWGVIVSISVAFLTLNAIFASVYLEVGGVEGARPGSYHDAFVFSVQTMATIGYGAMYPKGDAAHACVVAESIVGLVLTALATGIVFARFSRSSGRIVFSKRVCLSPMNGVPTLALRMGNDRSSTIFEAQVRLALVKTEHTTEGMTFYRLQDMKLTRERTPALTRSWTIMHVIDEESPLHGETPESCAEEEIELLVSVSGTDDTSMQPVYSRQRYTFEDFAWGMRLGDVLTELSDGRIQLDVRKFDDVLATEPIPGFPYPRKSERATSAKTKALGGPGSQGTPNR